MPVDAAAVALERLLVRRFELAQVLLNVDMFDRWGPQDGPERDRMMEEGGRARVEHDAVTAQLAALSAETWRRDPAAVRAWAEAHIELLERFIATHPDESDSTARFVAGEEIAGWREVAAGARPYVDENCYYVQIDRVRHAELFGPL
jgi:hypothetical protein